MRDARSDDELPSALSAPSQPCHPAAADGFLLLAERFPGIFWLTDAELRLTHISGTLMAESETPPETLVGKSLQDIMAPERVEETLTRHRRALAGEPTTFELDFGGRFLQARIEPLRRDDGGVEGVLGVAVETTEHKRGQQAEAELAALVQSSGDAIIGRGLDGTILSWNPAAHRVYGYLAEEVVGKHISLLVPPERAGELAQVEMRVSRGESISFETERLRKGGTKIMVSQTVSPVRDASGRVVSASMVVRDITGQKLAEHALRESEARKSAILESALDCIVTIDHECLIVEFNQAAERTFGYRRAEVIGRDMAELMIPQHLRKAHRDGFRRHLATGETAIMNQRIETTAMRSDGTAFPVELAVVRVEHNGTPVFSAHLRDITDRKQAEAEIAHLAYHDKLTGLPNRAMFEEHMQLALARAKRDGGAVAVLFLDLDNFKLVNDSLGHGAGDRLLTLVAERLREAARETDLVARGGGDEFLLLLADLGSERRLGQPDALQVAQTVSERVHSALQRPFEIEGTEFFISASIGIGVFPLHAEDRVELMRIVDVAMYESKWAGPGRSTVFTPDSGEVRSRLNLATELRRAAKDEQWALRYQPIVELDTGALVAVEALVRWRHPNGELLLPKVFLRVAEDIGLIDEIGRWVMDEATAQVSAWQEDGLDATVSINVSPRQFWHRETMRDIPDKLAAAGVDPSRVVIEVTESAAMSDPDRSQGIIEDLHAAGLRLAIDDFGTGYSSMSRLKQLPVEILKIDRQFVAGLPDDVEDRAVVSAMVQLAHNIGMEPLAEGVETTEQRDFLLEVGCRLGQGFLFSHPLAPEELLARYGPRGAAQSVGETLAG